MAKLTSARCTPFTYAARRYHGFEKPGFANLAHGLTAGGAACLGISARRTLAVGGAGVDLIAAA